MFILDMQFITKYGNCQKSHWRELNSRPTPYQGVAIPLSHSGVNFTNRDFGLIATEKIFKNFIQKIASLAIYTTSYTNAWNDRSVIGTNALIAILAVVVVLLSMILFVRVIRSRSTVSPDPWQTPLPMNKARQRNRATQPMVVPPPPQMFQHR